MKLLTRLSAVYDRFLDILTFIAGILVILMMLGVSADVVSRYFLNQSILGMDDVTQNMILWIVFLGAAWLLRKDKHVKMDLVTSRLNLRSQTILHTLTDIVGAIICLVLFWSGTQVTIQSIQTVSYRVGIIKIPTAAIVPIIPLGSLLLSIEFVRSAWRQWKKGKMLEADESRAKKLTSGILGG